MFLKEFKIGNKLINFKSENKLELEYKDFMDQKMSSEMKRNKLKLSLHLEDIQYDE